MTSAKEDTAKLVTMGTDRPEMYFPDAFDIIPFFHTDKITFSGKKFMKERVKEYDIPSLSH